MDEMRVECILVIVLILVYLKNEMEAESMVQYMCALKMHVVR